ncbi:MAG: glycosyltransferase family 1 protein [Aestuariivita sp.]|nr:glycosyltransferase family 1 protein [Aestuariivita sp.]
MPNYFFDISDLRNFLKKNDTVSGIQRATREIIPQVADELKKNDVFLTYFDSNTARFELLPKKTFELLVKSDIVELKSALRIKLSIYETVKGRVRNAEKSLESAISSCDVICGLGLTVSDPRSYAILSRLRSSKDIRIYLMIHDMIPLILPAASGIKPNIFFDYLVAATDYCEGFLANSKHTARDLKSFLDQVSSNTPINITPLACESLTGRAFLKTSNPETQSTHEQAGSASGINRKPKEPLSSPYVLCVGTMEARKNCWRIAQAWLLLARDPEVELPLLIFAGKRGWANGDFFSAYEATGGWGGLVQIIEQPSDDTLIDLYRHCEFTITASLYEGWGLPVGESLSYGKTALVSEVASLPEVGQDLVEYCDPHSIHSIAKGAKRLLCNTELKAKLEAKIAKSTLRSWSDVGKDIAAAIR